MADTTDMNQFLTDVADSIRSKTGGTEAIAASEFDTEIASITTVKNQDLIVPPTTSEETFTPDTGYTGFGTVTVEAVDASIDENIVPENIAEGVSILGVEGTHTSKTSISAMKDIIYNQTLSNIMTYNRIYFTNIDTSQITSMVSAFAYLFGSGGSTQWLVIEDLDTSNVTSMQNCFRGDTIHTTIQCPSWDTSNVTDMSYMFYGCTALTTLYINSFDMSNVTNTNYMFYGCSVLNIVYVKDETAKTIIDAALSDAGLSIESTIKEES